MQCSKSSTSSSLGRASYQSFEETRNQDMAFVDRATAAIVVILLYTACAGGVTLDRIVTTLPSSQFINHKVIYNNITAASYSSHRMVCSTSTCPCDVFSINTTTGTVSITKSLNFTNNSVKCARNNDDNYHVILDSFQCFIVRTFSTSSNSILLVIHVIPDYDVVSSDDHYVLKATSLGADGAGSVERTLVHYDRTMYQSIVSTLSPDNIAPLDYFLQSDSTTFAIQRQAVYCTSVMELYSLTAPKESFYNLTVLISTAPYYPHNVVVPVSIQIGVPYINYYTPVLVMNNITVTIPSNTPRHSVIATLTASDEDGGLVPAGTLRYLLKDHDGMHVFGVNAVTGEVTLLVNGESIEGGVYNGTVFVYDQGVPLHRSTETTITIFIESFGMATPNINITDNFGVGELTPPGTTVFTTLWVEDKDATNISTSLVCGTCTDCFQLTSYIQYSGQYNIMLTQQLNYEMIWSFTCSINVFDGKFSLLAVKEFAINVNDINEPPYFAQSNYSTTISELSPVNSVVLLVTAYDEDVSDQVVYSINGGDIMVQNMFAINPSTGLIYTKGTLSTLGSAAVLNISANDGEFEVFTTATILITPGDKAPPTFSAPSYQSVVYENVSNNEPIFGFVAHDNDRGCPGAIEYSIIQAEPPNFVIDSSSGLLYVSSYGLLKSEPLGYAIVTVKATSLGQYQDQFSVATLNLTILKSTNYNSLTVTHETPMFSTSTYNAYLLEGTNTGTPVLTVKATSNSSGTIVYSMSESVLFNIDASTGTVSVSVIIDRESLDNDTISLTVTGLDSGSSHMSTALVNIIITDVNDYRPDFVESEPVTVVMAESMPAGSVIYSARATDKDYGLNGHVHYTMDTINDHFYIHSTTGDIVLYRPVDYDQTTDPVNFDLVITATDVGVTPLSSSLTISVTVTDVNDNYPLFAHSVYRCHVNEGSTNSHAILSPSNTSCTVNATDKDLHSNVHYSIEEDSAIFNINEITGTISLTDEAINTIDYDTIPYHIITVIARDNGSPSLLATAQVIVDIIDYNDEKPLFDHLTTSIWVPSDLPIGAAIFTSHAIDSDAVDQLVGQLEYNLIMGTESFDINHETGMVVLDKELSQGDSYDIKILVSDGEGTGTTSDTVTVTVLPTNTNPTPPYFPHHSNQLIIEVVSTAAIGTVVYSLNATDDSDTVEYYITSRGYFSIDKVNGTVFVVEQLINIVDQQISLEILVTDAGVPPLYSLFNLTVLIVDDPSNPPVFTDAQYNMMVSESESGSSYILGHVLALVNGAYSDNLLYYITGYHGDLPFGVNNLTGAVYVDGPLDRETFAKYSFTVQCRLENSVTSSMPSLVAITISDSNDNRPQFVSSLTSVTLPHTYTIGEEVFRIFAVDKDDGINANLTSFVISPSDGIISVNESTGVASVQATPTPGIHNYTVTVSDSLFTRDLHMSVVITDQLSQLDNVNCGNNNVTVTEDTPIGTIIYTMSIGGGSNVFYKLVDDPYFTIHPSTGEVFLTTPLDMESHDHHNLSIIVWDGLSVNTSTCLLKVGVTNVNEHSPMFTSLVYRFTVSENVPINTTVGVVSAFDLDDGLSDIIFRIESSTSDEFTIDPIFGRVSVNVTGLDREQQETISMIVSATDEGDQQSFVSVVIEIMDTNDHIPLLPVWLPNITISENVPLGTHILTVSALDQDQHSSTSYALINEGSTPFVINSTTGVVTTSETIDYETPDSAHYQLQVIAVDDDNPLFNDTAMLHVFIHNDIDTVPELATVTDTVTIQENMPPGTFILSAATGGGVAPPHPIIYTLVNDEGLVYVETFTGVVRTLVPLDYEERQVYNVSIKGSYNSHYCTVLNVTILVEDVNDHKPESLVSDFTFTVSEEASVANDVIFDIGYFDRDAGSNGVIKFVHVLDPECDNVFSIDKTGKATLKQVIDREARDFYHCQVFVMDEGTPPLHLSHHISITVEDANDNPPSFDNEPFSFVVSVPVIVHEELFQVIASDKDKNSSISYTLLNGTETFAINPSTGAFSIHNNLRLSHLHSLLLQASDEGGLNTTTVVTVELRHCGFHNLTFQPSWYSVTVSEDTALGTLLLTTVISDFNTPGHFHYYITTDTDYFNVNSTTGEIYLQRELDYEETEGTEVLIQVRDEGEPARIAEAIVTITVADVNDNNPEFINTPYAVFMRDDTQIGTVIFTVEATDADSTSDIQYDIDTEASVTHGSVFGINTTKGAVTLYSYNDGTAHGERLELVITASDNGDLVSLSTNVTLVITVLSSNAPVFTESIYVSTIPESTPSGSVINIIQGRPSNISNAQLFYSIIDPLLDLKFPFSIHPYNGNLSINDRGIDYETKSFYDFFVRAEDTVLGVSTEVEVLVYIEDVNDNAPQFSQPLYTFTVSENTPINTIIGNVSASDDDTPLFAQIVYSLSSTDFLVDQLNGIIYTNVQLDYEDQQSHQFIIYANDRGVPIALQGLASVRVIVTNLNDNPPVLDSLTNQIPLVPEYPPKNHFITLVSGSDPDNNDIFYDLVVSKGSSNFIISDDGLLQVRSNVTILPDPSYNITVIASDGLHTVYQTITINILDINDHSPVFIHDVYYANVTEGSSMGVYVTMVTATDKDRGVNAKIQYSGNLDQFVVDSETGVITTSDTATDRETNEEYQLLVIGRDGGDRTGTTMVIIQVQDINDNVPQFSQAIYTVYITEGSMIGTSVLTVNALDPDQGINGTVTYSINGTAPFYMNSMTGIVTVFGTLDYETQPVWNITVLATDGRGLQSPPVLVNINLRNKADANPQFSQSKYEIDFEECPNGCASEYVSMVSVTYPDSCLSESVTIFDSSSSLPFTIESTTGIIRAVGNIRRISQDLYTFTLLARCTVLNSNTLDDLFATASVHITITDTNEPPMAPLLTLLTISEGAPINSTVGVVTGTDNDLGENSTLVYSVIESDGAVPFTIDPVSGEIKTSDVLDRESSDEHRFTVQVSDKGSPSLSAPYGGIVIVTVEDVNDSPPVIAVCVNETTECTFEATLDEGTPMGTTVLTLSIDDPDTINDISFKLSTTVFSFESIVNEDNAIIGGVMSTVQELDRETQDWYEFEAIVSDGIHTASILIFINITDINDQVPVFDESGYQVTINENFPPYKTVLAILATDNDIGVNAIVSYRLLGTPQLNNLTINSDSGEIYFLEPPDYEVSSRIDLLAQASDSGNLQSDTVSIVINILDLNDNAPEFIADNYTYSISENTIYGSDIGYVSAIDLDSGDNGLVTYHLNEDSVHFQVNLVNGLITSKQPLDRELANIHQLTIVARDNAVNHSMSSSTLVSIIVLDDNDNAPVFEGTNNGYHVVMVSEQASINNVVLTLNASDSDIGSNAELSFYLTGDGSEDFSLSSSPDGAQVTLAVAKPLNHEGTDRYDLTLGAIDAGIPSLETKLNLTILVSDENDNMPMFVRQYETAIYEDKAVGSVILTVEAFDLDSSDHSLIYSIKDEQDVFAINSSSGSVYISRSLDYETHQQYILTAIASEDNDNPQTAETTITINVLDVNDNPPVFVCNGEPCPVLVLHVNENQPFPLIIQNFTVTDMDTVTDVNNVSYSIEQGGDGVFTIDPVSGVLAVQESLDRELIDQYQLMIAASDNGLPPLTGYCNVTVVVGDVNDNGPIGGDQIIYIYLDNGEVGTTDFGRVYLNDKDILNSYEFSYKELPPDINWLTVSTDGVLQSQVPHPLINNGLYRMEISIIDTLYNGTVTYTVTMVTIEIRNVTVDAVSSSISMVVTGGGSVITRFINGNLIVLKETLYLYLQSVVGVEELLVYGITSQPQLKGIELQIAAKLANETYLSRDLLLYYLFINRGLIEESTLLSILTEDIDYCSSEPCGRDGLCILTEYHQLYNAAINKDTAVVFAGMETYHLVTCDCFADKTGKTCSENKLHCDQVDCGSNGECVELPTSNGGDVIGCQCNHGYVGESCDIPLESHDNNLCQPDPCHNGGTCTYSHAGFTCTCQTGFTGQTCSQPVELEVICGNNPCLHGGQCTPVNDSISLHHCTCPEGYAGQECELFVYGDSPCPRECKGCIYSSNRVHCVPPSTAVTTCASSMCSGNLSCPQDDATMCVDECLPNPCLNGGECVRMFPGYHCMCPIGRGHNGPSGRGLYGPDCQLTGITLTSDDSRVLLPSFQRLSSGEISLELSTLDTGNGTLLYITGTDQETVPDHIIMTIEEGYVHFRVSRGNGPAGSTKHYMFEEFRVNDGVWYTLLLQYDVNAINMSVTRYNSPSYVHQKTNTQSVNNYYFDTTLPVTIGKPLPSPIEATNSSIYGGPSRSILGCIRDVTVNRVLTDFSDALLIENGVTDGCGFRDGNCPDGVCDNAGQCVGEYSTDGGFDCVCSPVHSGATCSQVTPSVQFDGNLYIQYRIITKGLSKRQVVTEHSFGSTSITLSFSTVTSDGILIQLGHNSSDHIILKVTENHLGMSMSLNNGVDVIQSSLATISISDGFIHNATFTRKGKSYELILDNMYSLRGVVSGEDEVLKMASNDIYVGSDPHLKHGFSGCLHGMKLDNKDMPLSDSNEHFTAMPSEGGVVKSCDQTTPESPGILDVFDTLYILGGVVLGLLVVIVIVFVLVSRLSYHCYRKRRDKLEMMARRDPIFSPVNPIAINRRTSLPHSISLRGAAGIDSHFLQRTNSFEHFTVSDSSTSDISHTHRPNPIPSPPPPVQQAPLPPPPPSIIRRDSPSLPGDCQPLINDHTSRPTPVKVQIPKLPNKRPRTSQDPNPSSVSHQDPDPSGVSCQDPDPSGVSCQDSNPTGVSHQDPSPPHIIQELKPSHANLDSKLTCVSQDPKPFHNKRSRVNLNPKPSCVSLDPMTGMPLQELKRNETTSTIMSPTDTRNYIMEKVEETNKKTLAMISYDDMRVYNDEGDYVSLGSLGSLYDILDNNRNEEEFEISKAELERQLETIECTPKSTKHTPLVTSPLMTTFTKSPLKNQSDDRSSSYKPPVAKKPVKVPPKILKRPIQSKRKQPEHQLQLTEQLKDRTNKQWNQPPITSSKTAVTTTYYGESEML